MPFKLILWMLMLSTIRGSNSLSTAKKYIRSEKERQCGTELEASVVILNMCQMTLDRRRRGSIEMLGDPPPLHLNEQSEADTKLDVIDEGFDWVSFPDLSLDEKLNKMPMKLAETIELKPLEKISSHKC